MSLEPFDWNVIIIGRWNQAILTPAGIAKYLFKTGDPQTLEIAVPVDGISPFQVKCPDSAIVVMTEINRLRIQLLENDYDKLRTGMGIGVNALESLPETPVVAAGFNVKFRSSDHESDQINLVSSDIDSLLSDLHYRILNRTINRSLKYEDGKLNLVVAITDSGFEVSFNFHRGSKNYKDLVQWLKTPIEKVELTINDMFQALKLEIEETDDDD